VEDLQGNPGDAPTAASDHRETPPEDVQTRSRQVSWLAGRCGCRPSRCFRASGKNHSRSPLTVAGAASALPFPAHRIPS